MNEPAPPGGRRRRRRLVKKLGKHLLRGPVFRYLAKQSRVPNTPVIANEHFPWADDLAGRWRSIRSELEEQLMHHAALPSFQDISRDQKRISPDHLWKVFVLVGFGERSELNCRLCPQTARALSLVPGLETAFFSILAPGKHVPLHRGITKGMVRAHLALSVPNDAEQCWMECGGRKVVWREGELVFFDDTYPHAVWNNTDEMRAVLLLDFERPMTRGGQRLSRFMMQALRRTAYSLEARRNQREWEERYQQVIGRRPG